MAVDSRQKGQLVGVPVRGEQPQQSDPYAAQHRERHHQRDLMLSASVAHQAVEEGAGRSAELTTNPSRMRQNTTQLVSGSGEAQRPTGSNRAPSGNNRAPSGSISKITRMGQFMGVLGTGRRRRSSVGDDPASVDDPATQKKGCQQGEGQGNQSGHGSREPQRR